MSQIEFSHVLGEVEVHDGTFWRPAYAGLTVTGARIKVRTGRNAAATVWLNGAAANLSSNTLASVGGPISKRSDWDWQYWTGYVWSAIATTLNPDHGREPDDFIGGNCGGGIRG